MQPETGHRGRAGRVVAEPRRGARGRERGSARGLSEQARGVHERGGGAARQGRDRRAGGRTDHNGKADPSGAGLIADAWRRGHRPGARVSPIGHRLRVLRGGQNRRPGCMSSAPSQNSISPHRGAREGGLGASQGQPPSRQSSPGPAGSRNNVSKAGQNLLPTPTGFPVNRTRFVEVPVP